jgi:hypothetical protein
MPDGDKYRRLAKQCMRITVPLIVLNLSLPAQAQPEMLTLACQGTITKETAGTPQSISMGITVNFITLTVHGFGGTSDVKITYMDEAIIAFDGVDLVDSSQVTHWDTHGGMNRLTGDVEVTSTLMLLKTNTVASSTSYSLNRKPATLVQSRDCRPDL